MGFNPDLGLHALVIQLRAVNEGRLPATQGALAHAAFLDLVRAADPALATALHESGTRQPFTLSPLRALPAGEGGERGLLPGQEGWLRVTLLDPGLFAAFLRQLLGGGADLRLRLGDVVFAVDGAFGAPGSHPWAGYQTTGALAAAGQAAAGRASVRLQFASPTAMNLGKRGAARQRMVLLPWPQYVFASLRSAWNRATGDAIPLDFEQWVAEYVMVREVRNWQTGVYRLKNGVHPGGFGDVTYEALDREAEYVGLLNRLADFAFYSGVGSKTTMGMGQVRRLA